MKGKKNMFEINEITYYKTQDGESFETYEEAEEHNKALIEKENPLDELQIRVFNRDGELISSLAMYDYNNVWFLLTKTKRGAEFLENYLYEQGCGDIVIKSDTLYRYDEDGEYWVSQDEELEELNSRWKNIITFEEARC